MAKNQMENEKAYCLQGNGIDRADTAGCNGRGWCEDVSYTLNTIDRPAVYDASHDSAGSPSAYSFDSLASNSMKSKNPHSGCREVDVSKTLDCFDPNPAKNQGGIAILQPKAYGFEPGVAQRLNPEGRFSEELYPTLRADAGDNRASVICLNDQGGSVMDVTEDRTGTLRAQEHGHQPIVLDSAEGGCAYTMNPRPQSMVTQVEKAATLGADDYKEPQMVYVAQGTLPQGADPIVYENHSQDTRYRDLGDICQTVSATYGSGGNNQPLVVSPGRNPKDDVHQPCDGEVYTMNCKQMSMDVSNKTTGTIPATDYKDPQVVYTENIQKVTGPLMASGYSKNGTQEAANGMYVMQGFGDYKESGQASACKARDYKDATDLVVDKKPFCIEGNGTRQSHLGTGYSESDVMYTLNATEQHAVCPNDSSEERIFGLTDFGQYNEKVASLRACGGDCGNGSENLAVAPCQQDGDENTQETVGTLNTVDYKGPNSQYVNQGKLQYNANTVRRLTPLECERLQGYPDGWTDIGDWKDDKGKVRQSTDSARYKALGNSIALPYWFYLLRRISAQYERPATLGSLFDGISGFCLCWERCNGLGTAKWTSEIEPFPIAVCKKHFGDEETGEEGDIRQYL